VVCLAKDGRVDIGAYQDSGATAAVPNNLWNWLTVQMP